MDFTFNEDQLLFRESVRDFLVTEVIPEKIRELWDTDSGRSDELWTQLTDMGLVGMTVPEEFGGLGMNEVDFVLLAQECGYVALPEPLVHTALVAVPLLIELGGELAAQWLPKIAAGEARVVVGLEQNHLVEDAHIADLILLQRDGVLHAFTAAQVSLRHNESIDPSRRLFAVRHGSVWRRTAVATTWPARRYGSVSCSSSSVCSSGRWTTSSGRDRCSSKV